MRTTDNESAINSLRITLLFTLFFAASNAAFIDLPDDRFTPCLEAINMPISKPLINEVFLNHAVAVALNFFQGVTFFAKKMW